ncbi:MAG: hypothetical protein OXC05_06900 [Halieaceae bacterium]|nr:hypothetical protein [Halieaceae bacterium]
MSKTNKLAPKLVIYGTGFVGQTLTRLAVKKGWEIVAAFNRAGDKVGQDLGRLAGLQEDIGVPIQDCDKADYDAIEADVVLNATNDLLDQNMPVYERFLTRGINVLCHGGQLYNPRLSNRELSEKIDQLAQDNGVTITGSGIHDMSRYWSGMIAAGPCVEIDAVRHISYTEPLRQGTHFAPILGIDVSVDEYKSKVGPALSPYCKMMSFPVVTVLEYYGCKVTELNGHVEPVVWDEAVYCPYLKKEIAAGQSVGTRYIVEVQTEQGTTGHLVADQRVFRESDEEAMIWRVEGQPGVEVKVIREDSAIASASSLFNRIPDVLAAEPGLKTLVDLGPEKPSAFL